LAIAEGTLARKSKRKASFSFAFLSLIRTFAPMNRLLYIYALMALLMAACSSSRHGDMLAQLEELERQNVADSLMTNDSLAQALTEYFDRHGTPNEQLRAHYILGRTYADLGEAPAAIEAYLDAASRADTIASDCDYHTLSRVYGQMSSVFYRENLMHDYLHCLDLSVYYAWRDRDTLQALTEYAHKMSGYRRLHKGDSVISICRHIKQTFCEKGERNIAAAYCGFAIKDLLACGDIKTARHYMDFYEQESGFFDSNQNIIRGREAYYNTKGHYYLSVQNYDSAEYFFRKELHDGKDFNNQNMGAKGLAALFAQTNRLDSAAKYAMYSYDMNDSVYAEMTTDIVKQTAALYNYSRHEQAVHKERLRTETEQRKKQAILFAFCVSALLAASGLLVLYRKRKSAIALLNSKTEELCLMQNSLTQLRKDKASLDEIIKSDQSEMEKKSQQYYAIQSYANKLKTEIDEKEKQLSRLMKEVSQKHGKVSIGGKKRFGILSESPSFAVLLKKAPRGERLTDEEMSQADTLIRNASPQFYQFLTQRRHLLNDTEYYTCLLFNLSFTIKEVAGLLGVSSPNVSQISGRIMKKFYDEKGSGKDLKERMERFVQ
jgi:hypothetical protein